METVKETDFLASNLNSLQWFQMVEDKEIFTSENGLREFHFNIDNEDDFQRLLAAKTDYVQNYLNKE